MGENRGYVILDVDGVLLQMNEVSAQYMKMKYGASLSINHFSQWAYEMALGVPGWGDYGPPDQEMIDYVWSIPLKPYPKAIEFIRLLRALGFDVIGCSKRSTDNAKKAADRDFPQLNLSHYLLVDATEEKAKWVTKYQAKYFVDDNPWTCAQVGRMIHEDATSSTSTLIWLMDRPWNKTSVSIQRLWHRARDFDHMISEIIDHVMEGVE